MHRLCPLGLWTPPSKELKSGLSPKATSFRSDLSVVTLQLRNLKETASYARWEGNMRGHWPYEEYNKLIDIQQEMISVFAQVSRVLSRARTCDDSENS
jgi:hypothetical protein